MVNITYKNSTHRIATAQAIVTVSMEKTIAAIKEKKVPKGDIFEMSKAAGLLASKKTSDLIPDCHPIPIESASIKFDIADLDIRIVTEIQTIYKTGVEVEAMHAASVVALTIYDMLKPIDPSVSIREIKLLDKKGGKSDYSSNGNGLKAAVIVCSDSVSQGKKEDKAGKAIIKKLEALNIKISDYVIIPDETDIIQHAVTQHVNENNDLILLTGGTGLSPRDVTPEALSPLFDKQIPGIEEAIRAYGQKRTPYSMLSRSMAGLIGKTLVLGLPGSTRGAAESIDAVFPMILHIFDVMKGNQHYKKQQKKKF